MTNKQYVQIKKAIQDFTKRSTDASVNLSAVSEAIKGTPSENYLSIILNYVSDGTGIAMARIFALLEPFVPTEILRQLVIGVCMAVNLAATDIPESFITDINSN